MGETDGNLRGATFEHADLTAARFQVVNLTGARFEQVDMSRVVMRGVELFDVDITGVVGDLTINGVAVGPLIEAELDRRDPERVKMRPADPAGFREAWEIIERRWDETVARARRLEPRLLHESVQGEWSFIQTLRHLVFATDAWIRRVMLGDPHPWHPLDLPFDQMRPTPGVPWDREVRPALDEVLALRRDRMESMRRVLAELTDETLASHTTPVTGPGWPEPRSYPVRECLTCILSEEWMHRVYAERDLAVLESEHAVKLER
jgi:uncharacterized protein YjbI with pentapeptide repeats